MTIVKTYARFNVLSYFFYGILALSPFVMLFQQIMNPNDLSWKDWLLLLAVFFSIGLFALRILLWFTLGEETVLITDGELIVRKKGTFFIKREKRTSLKEIKSVIPFGNFYERNSPSKLVGVFSRQMYIFRIQNVGRIRVQLTNGKSFRFLDNINLDGAKEIADQIRREIN